MVKKYIKNAARTICRTTSYRIWIARNYIKKFSISYRDTLIGNAYNDRYEYGHYRQKAVLAYKISNDVIYKEQDERTRN